MGLCIMLEKLVHKNMSSYCVLISVEGSFYNFFENPSSSFYRLQWCVGFYRDCDYFIYHPQY